MGASILHLLIGSWFVVQSNFPLWLKGNKQHPTFNYTLQTKKGKEVLLDVVAYSKKGKAKTITGTDFPSEKNPNAFVWKGKGLLFIAKSRWEVKLIDENKQWAVIYFSKTLFTPEGVDVISRTSSLPDETLKHIFSLMEKDSLLRTHISSLKPIAQAAKP